MKPTFLFLPEHREDAEISIVGAPYDLNSSRRYGSKYAPEYIREESLYLEDNFLGIPLDLPVEDVGDVEAKNWNAFRKSLSETLSAITNKGSIPLVMGGDHSITPAIIETMKRKDISLVSIDAHLDFDDVLNGNRFSHGTPRRREAELLGGDAIHIIGIRSWPETSRKEAEDMGVHIHDILDVREKGIENIPLPDGPVYLSIDMDGIDPAYAPGTGTPEPFGLNPWEVLSLIRKLAGKSVGMDIVEVCPYCDINGMTSTLASRLMAAFISSFFSERAQR